MACVAAACDSHRAPGKRMARTLGCAARSCPDSALPQPVARPLPGPDFPADLPLTRGRLQRLEDGLPPTVLTGKQRIESSRDQTVRLQNTAVHCNVN